MRFIFLAPVSRQRTILRAGLSGDPWTIVAEPPQELARAVFAMPVVFDFWTTYQWLRELRRQHDGERMVAIHFRLNDDEPVWVGRYAQVHRLMTAAQSARWVSNNAMGAEVVIPRRILPSEITGAREIRQLIGWTEVPEINKKINCVCPGCLSIGTRTFMRRLRAAYQLGLASMRAARTDEELLSAMRSLEYPLQRSQGRIAPTKILAYAQAENPQVRAQMASLLGNCRPEHAEEVLFRLLEDTNLDVRGNAINSLSRTSDLPRVVRALQTCRDDVTVRFVEILECKRHLTAVASALEQLAQHNSTRVRAAVQRTARAILNGYDGAPRLKPRFEALVT